MRWNLSDPPRSVPVMVRLRVQFGGLLDQFGWLFFGFGMIFVWAFVLEADLTSWYVFRGDLAEVTGEITRCDETNYSVNDQTVHAIHYKYRAGGEEHTGVSYATGEARAVGSVVRVEHLPDDPATSRIAGMRRGVVGPACLFVLIFPAVGLAMLLPGLIRGRRGVRLLRDGKLAVGRLIDRQATNTQINERTVHKYAFEFKADDGRLHQVSGKTHLDDILDGDDPADLPEGIAYDAGPDDALEPLVYDPVDPKRAAVLDALPGRPRIDANGNIRVGGLAATLLRLVVPGLTLVGHGWYIVHRFF